MRRQPRDQRSARHNGKNDEPLHRAPRCGGTMPARPASRRALPPRQPVTNRLLPHRASAVTGASSTSIATWRQRLVGGLPDLSHAPLANEGGDVVMPEAGASGQGHGSVLVPCGAILRPARQRMYRIGRTTRLGTCSAGVGCRTTVRCQVPRRSPSVALLRAPGAQADGCSYVSVNTVSVSQRRNESLSMNCLKSSVSSWRRPVMTRPRALSCSIRAFCLSGCPLAFW